jgi:bla regulator protein blaR1
MIASYWLRLVWLALAGFFFIHFAVGSVVALLSRRALRSAERLRPQSAARFLLALRLCPTALSILAVAAVCVPSYLWLEPEAPQEQVGPLCLAAAVLAMVVWLMSISQGARVAAQSFRCMRRWRNEGGPERLSGLDTPAWLIESDVPFLALAGILRPRLIASRGLLTALSANQLAAALLHEQAHRASRDNLKRLAMHYAPGLFPFVSGFGALERGWVKFAERAADDRAVAKDPDCALSLAEALVRVARVGSVSQPLPLATALLADGTELHARVERLLHPAPPAANSAWRLRLTICGAASVLTAILLTPWALRLAHELLEALTR